MKFNLVFSDNSWEEYLYWQNSDKKMAEKINLFIKEISRNPYSGIGKPEPLRHTLSGYWSRRINDEHRMVYKVEANKITIIQLRYHY